MLDRSKSPGARVGAAIEASNAICDRARAATARILVIDDNAHLRLLLKEILEDAGHRVETAVDGRDGLRVLACVPCDLVLVDLIMPDMDGMETIRRLRQMNARLPILAMTGGGTKTSPGCTNGDFLAIAGKIGASGTLVKPFEGKALLHAVDALLCAGRGGRDRRIPLANGIASRAPTRSAPGPA